MRSMASFYLFIMFVSAGYVEKVTEVTSLYVTCRLSVHLYVCE